MQTTLSWRAAPAAAAARGGASDATRTGAASTPAAFRKLRRVTMFSGMANSIHDRLPIAMLKDSELGWSILSFLHQTQQSTTMNT
jgi:hypothetical protein